MPEENVNNLTETIPEGEDNPTTETIPADGETVATDVETPADKPEGETIDDSFLSPENKKSIDAELVKNPDLKPNYDNWYKLMQGDYTRKRQADSMKVKELETQAALVRQIQGDPELVKLIQQYKSGGLKQTPKAEAVADVIDKMTEDFSPEEKMLLDRLMPVFEKKIGQMIDPLQKSAATTEEKSSMAELSDDPEFIEIDVPTYWEDVKAIRGKYLNMPYREALALAIGKDFNNVATKLKEFGGEDAKKSNTTPAKKKAGFVAGGGESGAESVIEDDGETSAEAFRKKAGLKIAE